MHCSVVLTLDGVLMRSLMVSDISVGNNAFLNSFRQSVSASDWLTVHSLRQLLKHT